MFAAPPEVVAEVFTELPASIKPRSQSRWAEIRRRGKPAHSFLEGPAFDREGRLYVVDLANGRIYRISPKGEFELICEYDGEPNGLQVHRDGHIVIADHRLGLLNLDPQTGVVRPLLERNLLESFRGLNDLVFADNGDLYFTDQGETGLHDPTGRVYRLTAGGKLDLLLANVPSPNGIALNPDESVLYVAATRGNCVWRVPIEVTGAISRVGIFVQLSGGLAGPDGLATDSAGNLVICVNGLGTAWVVSRLGEPVIRIRSPRGLATTNAAFGGVDGRTLYILESETGTVLKVGMEHAGRRLFSHT
jgi:gluconolactonase